MILVVKSGGEQALPDWQACFAEVAPQLRLRWWDDPSVDPASIDYALVWDPEPGRLAQFPRLRAIFGSGAGVDFIAADPLLPRNLPLVRCVPPEATQRMGEHVAWAVLSLAKDARRMALAQSRGDWDYFEAPFAAAARTVGVMGLGAMGLRSVAMLQALGIPVVGWSRTVKAVAGVDTFAGAAGLPAFLARSRVLVCLLPATDETRGIIAAPLLARLPPGAGLVHVGRGVQMVLPDVLAALDSGHLAGAVLDVFDPEPLPADSPAWAHPRITVTPHVGSLPSRLERARYVADCIARFERGDPLPNIYDPERGY
ncbi:glyoxylate/hydroxypyruvate reductase A [Roseomonas sp. CECT 9278]|uniref:2-hydroxyacid dehydrogenase n=1 Tax=Roseomonas sp. CECT 9278 TaxID=2845823 RepID=UPI001E5DA3F1|nr:glyoxylate/hydroxypyruvate reductase A [Roseomonas sp. CECT 9278]CAH0183597.1 Glyoxylate/hydroxypyruvate reductase A [Roseomonas sp. CECT 9278]